MNERIKQIARKSGFYVPIQPALPGEDLKIQRIEKFAELLVLYCSDAIRELSDGEAYRDWDLGFECALDEAIQTINNILE